MASSSRFADPVTDAKEKEIRSKAIPDKTKATTDWEMKAWTDWACSRLISPADVVSRVLPTTPLLDILQVIWLTGWENLCLRCANRMAVSIHRNPYIMLWFAASKDFITKMNATILIHYVLLMKDLEIFEAPSMQK